MFSRVLAISVLLAPALATTVPQRHDSSFELEERAAQAGMVPVYDSCAVDGTFGLTFDDGPNFEGWDADLLRTLKKSNASSTFFMNGYNWGCIYDAAEDVKTIFNSGHQIGAHSWSHPDLTTLSEKEIDQQFAILETAFAKILGVKPLYARAPYGAYNDAVRRVLYKRGYTALIQWTIDSGDAEDRSSAYGVSQYKNARSKDIALNHDQYKTTIYQTIPKVLPQLVKKGLKVTTIAKCLKGSSASPSGTGANAYYKVVGTPEKKNKSWTCAGTPAPSDG